MVTQTNPFLDLCAPGIGSLQPYVPGKPVEALERELGISGSIKLNVAPSIPIISNGPLEGVVRISRAGSPS